MKKRNRAVLVFIAAVLLTACGRTADTKITTEEIVVPEMSSEDILVNSLEYLLEEEQEKNPSQEEAEEREEETHGDQPGEEGVEPQENDETEETGIVICYGKDMESGLMEETITAEEITPEVLVSALARHNILPLLDMKVLSMKEMEEDGRTVLYLDLSGTFREYLQTMSREAECIIISSVTNTFLANYDADAIYITVEGEALVTANAEYTEAISGYTPGELMTRLTSADEMEEQ